MAFPRHSPFQNAIQVYHPGINSIPILSIFSDFVDHTRDGGWAKLIDRLNLVECDADHEGIMGPECVQQNQQILNEICEQAATSQYPL